MKLKNSGAEIFVPDNRPIEEAISRTTHMGILAHQDDLEIAAYDGILKCFGNNKNWFFGIIVTNGSGSPRAGIYEKYSDENMQKMRRSEQRKAAVMGEYGAVAFLDYPSSTIKNSKDQNLKEDIKNLLQTAKPSIVYTHNLADKHDTHVAVALRTIQSLRELPDNIKPKYVYGCEVWRSLDWMVDGDKVAFDVSARENLAASLIGIFDSQISGGKRYDLATLGRRRANATYHASQGVDTATSLIYGMDLTPLINNKNLDIEEYITKYISRFSQEVSVRIKKSLG